MNHYNSFQLTRCLGSSGVAVAAAAEGVFAVDDDGLGSPDDFFFFCFSASARRSAI
jgi:hypothetical protein